MVFGGWQTGDDDHENLVAWQVPDAGAPSEDGQVKVGVYSGRERLQLSSFKGLDQVSVETQLTNQGLVVKVQVEDSDQPRGIIVDHFPVAGTTVKKGDTVTLIVSSGHPPPSTTAKPGGPPSS
jgi:serine/threonine-protein kinase